VNFSGGVITDGIISTNKSTYYDKAFSSAMSAFQELRVGRWGVTTGGNVDFALVGVTKQANFVRI
jgi:hypothetical protein